MQNPVIGAQAPQLTTNFVSSLELRRCLAVEYSTSTLETEPDAATVALLELNANITMAQNHNVTYLQYKKMISLGHSPKYQTCMLKVDSAILIIHDDEAPQQEALSAASYLCGGMSVEPEAGKNVFKLAFFCGMHMADGARFQGGRRLMRGLTLQLLSSMPDESFPTPVDPSSVTERVKDGDLNMITSVFAMALDHFSEDVVYVLIDGVQWNDTKARSAEMRAVVRFLDKMVEYLRVWKKELTLKVVVTNPSGRQRLEWDIQAEDISMES